MAIYLDNAATTMIDPAVKAAMLPYLEEQFGNPSAIHSMGRPVRAAIERSRKAIAASLNASPSEIFFTSCGTEANNTALLGAVKDLGVERIISSEIEHHCILHFLEFLNKNFGTEIVYLGVNSKGRIDYEELAATVAASDKKTLVTLMHANNEIGTMIDLQKVSDICREAGALVHSDTVQTFGHFKFDLQETPMDFMVCSAHKIHGPKGVGFLYINGEHKISPLLYGGSQERNMRAGTENVMGIVGLGKAVEIAYEKLEHEMEYIKGLRDFMKAELEESIPNIEFNGDPEGESLYTVLNVSFPCTTNEMLLTNLDILGICASGGSACSSGVDLGSHVLQAINSDVSRTPVRFSFSKFNTKEEVVTVLDKISSFFKVEA